MVHHRLRARRPGFPFPAWERFFSYPLRPNRLWCIVSLLSGGHLGVCSPGVKRQWHEAHRLSTSDVNVKNGGATSQLPHTFSWRGASLIKDRGMFTFTFVVHLYRQTHTHVCIRTHPKARRPQLCGPPGLCYCIQLWDFML